MSYCVNCGVELDKSQKECPLCSTPVINPNESLESDAPAPYPRTETVAGAMRKLRSIAVMLVTVILFLPLLVCPLCDFIITGRITWSVYVIASVVYAYTVVIPPLVFKRNILVKCVWIDFFTTLTFLYVINKVTTPDSNWFYILVVPISIFAMFGFHIILWACRRINVLSTVSLSFLISAFFSIYLEYILSVFLQRSFMISWSLLVSASCLALALVFLLISRMTRLRASIKKRMHL